MKKFLILICFMVFIFSVYNIYLLNMNTSTGVYIKGNNETNIIIIDNIPMSMENVNFNKNIFKDLNNGDLIKIKYRISKKTYPTMVNVYNCSYIKGNCMENVSEDTINELKNLGWIQ